MAGPRDTSRKGVGEKKAVRASTAKRHFALYRFLSQEVFHNFPSGSRFEGAQKQQFKTGVSCAQEDKSSLQLWDKVSTARSHRAQDGSVGMGQALEVD